jgi:aryl-alcohol dehydrogenase-like predicted oxidoreductase
MATREATWAYRDRFGDRFGRTYFRRFGPGVISSIGLGTYLGDPTDAVDAGYHESVMAAVEHGINVVDTAVNYRHQRSERVVGRALADTDIDREAVLVATKGGFVPFDGERPAAPGDYVRREFVDSGLVDPDDLAHGSHCIAPGFIDAMVDRSLENLGLESLDLYYVHNPETQLDARSDAAVYDQLEATFERLEERVAAGDIGAYGVATWEAFRVDPSHEHYLSLPEVVARAEAAAGTVGAESHSLEAVQLPFNVSMADAFTVECQPGPEGEATRSALETVEDLGLGAFTSASIGQGDLAAGVPGDVDAELAGDTAAQRAVNFARSAPGVTCSLVGASDPEHVAENVAAGTFDPLGARAFDGVFG